MPQIVVLLIGWHIFVQIIWHTRSFLAVPADPGKRLKLHISSEYAFPKPFHTRFATGAPNNKLRSVPDNARSNNLGHHRLSLPTEILPPMANTFGHPDACSRVLRILGLEQPDALLARGQSWHPNGMMQAN
jgi:hypothetical protein